MHRSRRSTRGLRSAALALVVLGVAGSAHAGTIVTASLWRGAGDDFNCRVLNLGAQTGSADIEILGQNGNVQASASGASVAVGSTSSVTDSTPDIEGYCRVEVPGIAKSKLRVAFCLRDADNSPLSCVTGE